LAVAFDKIVESGLPTSGNFSFTHTPVGTPRAAVLWVVLDINTTDQVSGVTYGGVSMSEVSGSPNIHTTGQPGSVHCFFLGSSVPTGAQTVAGTVGGTNLRSVVVVTLTAATDCEIVDADATINSDSQANPSVTLSLGGRTSWCGIGFHSGQANTASITPLASWTSSHERDFGSQVGGVYRYDTVGTADVTAGWTQTAADACAIAVAVSEVAGGGGGTTRRRDLLLLGVGA
jgi:hypothetical protein